MDYKKARFYLENGHPEKCADFFRENKYPLEYGYSLFLQGELGSAEVIFKSLKSVRADWAIKLISVINGNTDVYPTYFQVRDFLEIDINLLFKVNRIDYINKILLAADMFQQENNESYKFFGRVLLKNNYPNEAKIFFDKSLDNYYNDVELHYLYVEYYLQGKDYANALRAVNNCLKINSGYYPALRMKKILSTSNAEKQKV